MSIASFETHIENFGSTLMCPLCHELLHEPASINGCRHIFCKSCISEPLGTEGACPICHLPAQPKDLVKNTVANAIVQHYLLLRRLENTSKTRRPEEMERIPATQQDGGNAYNLMVCTFDYKNTELPHDKMKRTKATVHKADGRTRMKNEKAVALETGRSCKPRNLILNTKKLSSKSLYQNIDLKYMMQTGKIHRGAIFKFFDCESRLTKNGTLRDFLDGEEYTFSKWINLVCRIVLKSPKNYIDHVLVDGQSFASIIS